MYPLDFISPSTTTVHCELRDKTMFGKIEIGKSKFDNATNKKSTIENHKIKSV
jgi:hypothetical protein